MKIDQTQREDLQRLSSRVIGTISGGSRSAQPPWLPCANPLAEPTEAGRIGPKSQLSNNPLH